MTQTFNLSAAKLFRAMPICQANSRYYLEGALIDPIPGGGAWIVATNGHCMLVQWDKHAAVPARAVLKVRAPEAEPDFDGEDYTTAEHHWCGRRIHIPDTVLKQPVAAPVFWEPDSDSSESNYTESYSCCTHVIAEAVDAAESYPDWRQAISAIRKESDPPRIPSDRFTALETHHLSLLAGWARGFEVFPAEPGQARLISFVDAPDTFGVIMPMARNKENHLAELLPAVGRAELLQEGASAPKEDT